MLEGLKPLLTTKPMKGVVEVATCITPNIQQSQILNNSIYLTKDFKDVLNKLTDKHFQTFILPSNI